MNKNLNTIMGTGLLLSLLSGACTLDTAEPVQPDHIADHDITDTQATARRDRAVEVTVDGVPNTESIIASVVAEDATQFYFLQGSEDEQGHSSVDVVIIGREGGFDYGALLGSDKATPLELYVAVAGEEAQIPQVLERDHIRLARTHRLDDALQPPEIPVLSPEPGLNSNVTQTGVSTFTCLSWTNFNTFVNSIFWGAPGREYKVDANVNGHKELWLPASNASYPDGRADMVACNYNSPGSTNTDPADRINAAACHYEGVFNPSEHCVNFQMWDGEYIRRIYGLQDLHRRYRIATVPVNGASLQSYLAIVRRN